MDSGKYKYAMQKKQAEMRRSQKVVEIKEVKLRPMIEENDYQVKFRNMQKFLSEGNKVKITLRFRGREMRHQEAGTALFERIREDLGEDIKIESEPKLEGRQMVMVVSPK